MPTNVHLLVGTRAVCGASMTSGQATAIPAHVTCLDCRQMLRFQEQPGREAKRSDA